MEIAKSEGIKDFTKYQDWIQEHIEKLKYQHKYALGKNIKNFKKIPNFEFGVKRMKYVFVDQNHFWSVLFIIKRFSLKIIFANL